MVLLCENFKVVLDDLTGTPLELTASNDPYQMNWIRKDYPWGAVAGFELRRVEAEANGISIFSINIFPFFWVYFS